MTQTQPPVSPFSVPAPWDNVSSGYAKVTMRNLAQYAEEALLLADLTPSSRILDVACGPGTLSLLATEDVAHVTALDFSPEMLNIFGDTIRARKIANIEIHQGDGQDLPFAQDSFDAAFSMFGLMFFPDRAKGFAELYRTLKPGGRAVVSSWAPAAKSPFMKPIFEAIQVMTTEIPGPAPAMMLDDPAVFRQEMEAAGFTEVEVKPVTKHFALNSLESYWKEAIEGHARVAMLKKTLPPEVWKEKEKLALASLKKTLPQLPTVLSCTAWLAVGVK